MKNSGFILSCLFFFLSIQPSDTPYRPLAGQSRLPHGIIVSTQQAFIQPLTFMRSGPQQQIMPSDQRMLPSEMPAIPASGSYMSRPYEAESCLSACCLKALCCISKSKREKIASCWDATKCCQLSEEAERAANGIDEYPS